MFIYYLFWLLGEEDLHMHVGIHIDIYTHIYICIVTYYILHVLYIQSITILYYQILIAKKSGLTMFDLPSLLNTLNLLLYLVHVRLGRSSKRHLMEM